MAPPKKKAGGALGSLESKINKKVGPLPLWGWGAVALGGYFVYAHFIAPATAADTSGDAVGSGSSALNGAGGGGGGGGNQPPGTKPPKKKLNCPPGTHAGPMGVHCLKNKNPRCPHLNCPSGTRMDLQTCRCVRGEPGSKPPVGAKPPVKGKHPRNPASRPNRPAAPHSTRDLTTSGKGSAGGGGQFKPGSGRDQKPVRR